MFCNLFHFNYLTIYVQTNIQLVHVSDNPYSHNLGVDHDDVEVAVNAAYSFGASPLTVRTLLFNLSSLFTYL